jgi:hypothetical protein
MAAAGAAGDAVAMEAAVAAVDTAAAAAATDKNAGSVAFIEPVAKPRMANDGRVLPRLEMVIE